MPHPYLSSKSTNPSPQILHRGCLHDTSRQPFYRMELPCENRGGACSNTTESVAKLLKEDTFENQEVSIVDSKNVIECHEKEPICRDSPCLNGKEADSTGVTTQVTVVSLKPIQQNEGNDALIDNTAECEQVVDRPGEEAFHPDKGWKKMKKNLNKVEQFCKSLKDSTLYDWSKEALDRGKYGLDRIKEILIGFWEQVVKYMENNLKKRGSREWQKWLHEGTRFRRVVEPLDIASCCHKGLRYDYLPRRRKCFRLLEQWQKDEKTQPQAGPPDSKRQKIETDDSCFWFHVQRALQSCRLLISGGPSDDSQREVLRQFEKYVMALIKKKAVSTDIFLENSTFMQWWSEYEGILANQMMGHSHDSELVSFMRNEPRKNYVNG